MNTRIKKIMFICAIIMWHMCFANVNILQAQSANTVGAIPGSIDVSPMGAATYTIPIEVVPGTQGMQPNLSIVYNSFGGMGILGMKWNLAGLSAITRCGQNPYYDSNITAIQFDSQSRFALDGERLININGDYGVNVTEYATEIENFTRVVQYGTSSTWQTFHFKVYTDDGTIIEYGNTDDSKLLMRIPRPTAPILDWQINKITDVNGNYMTFHYKPQQYNGEILIDSICYTGNLNNAMQPYATVKFEYVDLPETMGKNTCFISGYDIQQTKLLNSITAYYGNTIVRKYQFNYNLNDPGERTAHLKEVILSEYDASGTEKQLTSTTIKWGTQKNTIEDSSLSNFSTGSIVTGDFNGDGYTDYVAFNENSGTSKSFQLYLYNPANNTFSSAGATGNGISLKSYAYSCDYYGIGKDALILAENFGTSGTYWITAYTYENNDWRGIDELGEVANFVQAHFGDFTGDGKVNIMYEAKQKVGKIDKYTLSFSNNDFSSTSLQLEDIDNIQIIDYNGNGKANIQITKGEYTDIYEYSATNQKFELVAPRYSPPISYWFYYGDFSGDGITDRLRFEFISIEQGYDVQNNVYYFFYNGKWVIDFGIGYGTYQTSENSINIPWNELTNIGGSLVFIAKYDLFIADINGDGKDDIIQVVYDKDLQKTFLYIYYSKGYANGKYQFKQSLTFFDGDYSDFGNLIYDKLWHVNDFNGDGKNDLLLRKSKTDASPKMICFNKNEQYEYAASFTDGLGKKDSIVYTSKYISCASPSQDQKKKFFAQLAAEIQFSNGINNDVNKLQFRYWNPVYSFQRRTFLGFSQLATINTVHSAIDSLCFASNSNREILLPQYKFLTKTVSPYTVNQVSYSYTIVPLSDPRFILHNHFIKNQDFLSDTKTETVTTLEGGRLKTSNAKTFNGSNASTWLHSETNTYSYNTITLNGNQKKTVPTQILTTQQYGSSGVIIADTVTCNYFTSGANKGRLNWKRQGNLDGSITTTYGNYTTTGLAREKTVSAAGVSSRKEYYEYDNTHRFITKIKNHLLHETTMTYNAKTGNQLSETDINGLITTYNYDTFGNLTQITYPDGTITKDTIYWFTGVNLPNAKYCTKTISSGKPDLIVYYDKLGREVCRKDDGYYYDTRYNNKGQVVKTSYPYSNLKNADATKIWSEFTYDNLGRKNTETAPYTDLSYSYNNRKVTVTDHLRNNQSSYKDYDALGRIVQAKDEGGIITYSYTVINESTKKRHRTTIITNGTTTQIKSDLWGNRLSINEPNAGLITSEYNKLNELTKQTDANGNVTAWQYDVLGRMTKKEFSLAGRVLQTINYTYDYSSSSNKGKGKLYQVITNNVLEETYTYNNLSRLFQYNKVIDNIPHTFSYYYTPTGQLHEMVYPDDFTVIYNYSSTGKLNEIRGGNYENNLIYKVHSRNKFGKITLCSFGNDLATHYTYNAYGLLTRINTGNQIAVAEEQANDLEEVEILRGFFNSADSTVLNYRYAYDNKGLMNSRSESINNYLETFTYDNLNRLTGITSGTMKKPQPPQTISYALNGNIAYNPNVGSYAYNSSKPHAVTQIEPINNNVISSNQCAVTYNFFNQPTQITEGNNQIDIFYGANQQRNKTVIAGDDNCTRYHINKYYEVEQRIHRPIPPPQNYHYIYGDNGIVALHIDKVYPLNHSTEDSTYYIHTDHLGSYCAITNADKQVVLRNHFDPWGNFTVRDYTPYFHENPLTYRGFTGHEHYPYFNIINMNGRLYDPVIGRFFSPDQYVQNPEFTQSYNRYSYARNCPLMYIDPDGEWEYSWNIETNYWAMTGFTGFDQTQHVNIINASGNSIGNYTFPGFASNLNRTWGKDDFGNIHFSISAWEAGVTSNGSWMNSASLSGAYYPGYYYGDGLFMPSSSKIDYTSSNHEVTFDYTLPTNTTFGEEGLTPIYLENLVIIDRTAGLLVKGMLSTITKMIGAKAITAGTKMIAKEGMQAGKAIPAGQMAVHGNSLKSTRPTWGYKLYSNDGTFLKNGITSQVIPETRYTRTFMLDKNMKERILFPNRIEAWNWELQQNLILRGPLNKGLH